MRHVVNVLVRGQLDIDTYSMRTSESGARPHAEKMIYVPRSSEVSADSHMVRWSRLLRNCRDKHEFLHGDDTSFARYLSWCGHIARITTRDPGRETSRMYVNRNIALLRDLKKELGTQCHGRRFRVSRWEQAVAQCIGEKGVYKAQSNTGWRAKQEEMIAWIKQKLEDRKCVAME